MSQLTQLKPFNIKGKVVETFDGKYMVDSNRVKQLESQVVQLKESIIKLEKDIVQGQAEVERTSE
jgi:hypothetical protein